MNRRPKLSRGRPAAVIAILAAVLAVSLALPAAAEQAKMLHDERESHLADVVQLTFKGDNAEAYWSADGKLLTLQARFPPYECDQIFHLDPAKPGELTLVSTGKGRTTCSYFFPDGERILYSSTHLGGDACPPAPDHSQGYVWPLFSSYEIFTAKPDGSDLKPLTQVEGYDAEATICPLDGSIVFTSTRDGDLELYRMDADGANVKRLTHTPGYDGGAFFSADCKQIVWRASRPEGEALADYQRLLAADLVRPGKLDVWVAAADGSNPRQVTHLGGASFAPYFFPSGQRIIFASNHHSESGREFDIWAINVDGTDLERITYTDGFDGFPMFSPDGKRLAFASNRNQGKPGETDVYVARWVD
jgi:Tol biopolymer transport system component